MAREFFEFLDFLEDVDFRNEVLTRPRVTRSRPNWFNDYDELDFFKRYRMHKSTVLYILEQIDEDLEFTSDRNCSVAPIIQLLITLRFYATGSHLLAIGDLHGVNVSTVSRIVKRVSNALVVRLRARNIKMASTEAEIERCQREFYSIADFPYVIGTIDCTHVKIQSPGGNDAELFRNRKGYFSLNVQTISNANLKVQNIVARWPGSTHDSAIFTNSVVCQEFESGRYGQACLLGDSGYPLKVLDATFDDLLPLAEKQMPRSWLLLVREVVRTHVDLNVAELVTRFHGPVQIVRRIEDEIICLRPGVLASNRGNDLLLKLIEARHHLTSQDVESTAPLKKLVALLDHQRATLERSDISAEDRILLKLIGTYLVDYESSHCVPLPEQMFESIMTKLSEQTAKKVK